jgi:hypothetical protein
VAQGEPDRAAEWAGYMSTLIRVRTSIGLPRIQVLRLGVSLNLITIAAAHQNSGLFGECRGAAECDDGLYQIGVCLYSSALTLLQVGALFRGCSSSNGLLSLTYNPAKEYKISAALRLV